MVSFLDSLKDKSIQPPLALIFKVFEMPVDKIKVVILGQNPYPRPGTAVGRAYAVPKETRMPAILEFIQKEVLRYQLNPIAMSSMLTGNWQALEHWTEQGVFLLNTALTVDTEGGNHALEWKEFTEKVIAFISQENPCIWMLWGTYAHAFGNYILNPLEVEKYDDELMEDIPVDPLLNYTVSGLHPISGPGFSKEGFIKVNSLLEKRSLTKIMW
jgi:uracil-DNA glycosylase